MFFFRCLKWTRSCIAFVRVGTGITTEPTDTNLARTHRLATMSRGNSPHLPVVVGLQQLMVRMAPKSRQRICLHFEAEIRNREKGKEREKQAKREQAVKAR